MQRCPAVILDALDKCLAKVYTLSIQCRNSHLSFCISFLKDNSYVIAKIVVSTSFFTETCLT